MVLLPYQQAIEILSGIVQEERLKDIRELYIKAYNSAQDTDSLQVKKMSVQKATLKTQSYIVELKSQELGLSARENKLLRKEIFRLKVSAFGGMGLSIILAGTLVYLQIFK